MNIEYMNIADLKPYEKNAKKHDEKQIENVMQSIKEFGFAQPLVVDKDNVLIIGHCRLLASKRLGLDKVPVVRMNDLTEEQVKALRLADNKTNESPWDYGLLELELSELELDMSLFGFDDELSDEKKEKSQSKKLYEEMQLKQFEHHDYIVFVFENQMDWLNVLSTFEIGKVNAGYGKTKKIGIGRVINGKRLLEKLGYENSDFEPWEMELDTDE